VKRIMGRKFKKLCSSGCAWWGIPVIPVMCGSKIGGLQFEAYPDKMSSPIPKITKAKKGWSMAPVVEHFPSKHKTLSSNPRIAQNKTNKKLCFSYKIFNTFGVYEVSR
jgi:hypothetical protein